MNPPSHFLKLLLKYLLIVAQNNTTSLSRCVFRTIYVFKTHLLPCFSFFLLCLSIKVYSVLFRIHMLIWRMLTCSWCRCILYKYLYHLIFDLLMCFLFLYFCNWMFCSLIANCKCSFLGYFLIVDIGLLVLEMPYVLSSRKTSRQIIDMIVSLLMLITMSSSSQYFKEEGVTIVHKLSELEWIRAFTTSYFMLLFDIWVWYWRMRILRLDFIF